MPESKQEIVAHSEAQPAASEATAIVQMIERAASNPAVDIDKMERLLQMQERVMARRAKAEYATALALVQAKLPVIGERGEIIIKERGTERIVQRTRYARWEDINEAIKPVLAAHGFSLQFRTGLADDGRVMVTGILRHAGGHEEETTMVLPHDSTGSKNAVQAIGSSTSYGKRYTAISLLNITSGGEDDDGQGGRRRQDLITEEQAVELRELMEAVAVNEKRFLKVYKVEKLGDLLAADFQQAKQDLIDHGRSTGRIK